TVTAGGPLRLAKVAGPPSPPNSAVPSPAKVNIVANCAPADGSGVGVLDSVEERVEGDVDETDTEQVAELVDVTVAIAVAVAEADAVAEFDASVKTVRLTEQTMPGLVFV